MKLSELEDMPLRFHVYRVYKLLKDIVEGSYPSIDLFKDKEVKKLLDGEDLEDVKSPFWALGPNMEIDVLPLMELTTTKDVYRRKRQMKILDFFTTVNTTPLTLSPPCPTD